MQPSVFHRATKVPYGALREEANALNPDCVQDAFCLSCDPVVRLQLDCSLRVAPESAERVPLGQSISAQAVSAVLEQSLDRECPPPQAFLLPQLIQSIQPSEKPDLLPLSRDELIGKQRDFPCLGRVLHFVERHRRPSRRERAHEPVDTLRLRRHWEKLTVKSGVLCCTFKDAVMKRKTYQCVVPSAVQSHPWKYDPSLST